MLKIKTFQKPYTPKDAEIILYNCDTNINIVKMEPVYYPYKRLLYSLTLPGKLSRLDKEVSCVMDLVSGRPAVGQGLPDFKEMEIEESAALRPQLDEERMYELGYNFVFKLFLNKSKILRPPKIELMEEELFYKMFYVTQCKDEEELDYFVLVDSMDGNLAILDWKVPTAEQEVMDEQK